MEREVLIALAVIAACAAITPLLAEYTPGRRVPRVVYEILLGIVVGPFVLGWVEPNEVIDGFSELGIAFLMFLAGFEIDLQRVRGRPIKRAVSGWFLSLTLGIGVGFVLMESGLVVSDLIVGLAITTTALGTLLPILQDAKVLETDLGTRIMAIGTAGEFLPIVAVALLLSGDAPVHTLVLLGVFVAVSLLAAVLAFRSHPPKLVLLLQRHLHSTAQLPIRFIVLLIVVLLLVANTLGLDVLLGAFVAGVVVRLATTGEDTRAIDSKLEGIAYGFFIPLFFVVSGTHFDVEALAAEPATLLRVPLFLVLMLVARAVPTYLLNGDAVSNRARLGLSFLAATQLPLVVVITEIGLRTDQMLPSNAAALVGAGLLSVLIFPLIGLALAKADSEPSDEAAPSDQPDQPDPSDPLPSAAT